MTIAPRTVMKPTVVVTRRPADWALMSGRVLMRIMTIMRAMIPPTAVPKEPKMDILKPYLRDAEVFVALDPSSSVVVMSFGVLVSWLDACSEFGALMASFSTAVRMQ